MTSRDDGGPVRLTWYRWPDLSPDLLYAFLKLRSDVFVVEQNCAFADPDGLDPQCEHLCASGTGGRLLGYLRLLPLGLKKPQPSLGRLVVDPAARHLKIGRSLMEAGLARCAGLYPGQAVHLGGQRHLQGFYESLGFEVTGEPYLEDGIPHVDMLKKASAILPR